MGIAMTKFSHTEPFHVISCVHCQFPFGVPDRADEHWRKSKRTFYCPQCRGSQGYYGKSEKEKRLEEAERRLEQEQIRASDAEQKAIRMSRQYSRVRDRVKNGVCPCCNRTFDNVARHMASKHKDWGTTEQFKQLRLMYGLTQDALGEEIGLSAASVSLYERGKHVSERARSQIETWLAEQQAS